MKILQPKVGEFYRYLGNARGCITGSVIQIRRVGRIAISAIVRSGMLLGKGPSRIISMSNSLKEHVWKKISSLHEADEAKTLEREDICSCPISALMSNVGHLPNCPETKSSSENNLLEAGTLLTYNVEGPFKGILVITLEDSADGPSVPGKVLYSLYRPIKELKKIMIILEKVRVGDWKIINSIFGGDLKCFCPTRKITYGKMGHAITCDVLRVKARYCIVKSTLARMRKDV